MLTFLYIKTIFFINVQCLRVNNSEAVRLCTGRGGLAASSNFPRVDVTLMNYEQQRGSVLYSQLKNVDLDYGESAWVAGYAIYGDFYSHFGCYPYDHQSTFTSSDNQEHRGFYQCAEFCKKQDVSLNSTSCFCVHANNVQKRSACPKNIQDRLLLELYRRRNRYEYSTTYVSNLYQCSIIGENTQPARKETTSKCSRKKNLVCTYVTEQIICTNNTSKRTSYCDVGYPTTWIEGVKVCSSLGGMMIPFVSPESTESMKNDAQYWTGGVSPYTIEAEPGDACLAVTRLGNHLVLEPDDCRAKNSYICASDIMHSSDDKHAKPSSPTSTPDNKQAPNPSAPITSPAESSAGTNTVVIIIVCCLVFAAVAAISVFIYKRKKSSHKDGRKPLMAQPSANLSDDLIENVAESDYATVDENETVRSKSGTERDCSENLLQSATSGATLERKTPPEKPTRHTLRRKNNIEPYENVPLSKGTLDNRKNDCKDREESMADEYNVLSYNQPAQPARKQGEGEVHVYDHMPAIANAQRSDDETQTSTNDGRNEYDTTESVQVLLHGDYATSQSLQRAAKPDGEHDKRQIEQKMLRDNRQPDNAYSHTPNTLDMTKAEDALKDTGDTHADITGILDITTS